MILSLQTTIAGRELTIHESAVIKSAAQNIGIGCSYSRVANKLSFTSKKKRVELFCGNIERMEVTGERIDIFLPEEKAVKIFQGEITGDSLPSAEKAGWISMREAEKKYGVYRSTFSRWIQKGKLRTFPGTGAYDTWLLEEEVKDKIAGSKRISHRKREEEIRERTGRDGKMPEMRK